MNDNGTIVRADTQGKIPWFQMSRALAQDDRLSLEHKGLMLYLLSKPYNWKVQVSDIRKTHNIGKDKAYRLLKELQEFGYVEYVNERDDSGSFSGGYYRVYDSPDMNATATCVHRRPENPDSGEQGPYSKESITVERVVQAKRKRHTTPEHIVVANSAGLDAKQMRELVDAVLDVTGKRVVADGDDLFADRALAGAQECAAGLVSRGVTTPAAVVKLAEAFQQVYGFKNPPAYSQLVGAVSLVPQTNGAAPAEYQFEEWGDD